MKKKDMTRRTLLTVVAGAFAACAGCSSGSDDSPERTPPDEFPEEKRSARGTAGPIETTVEREEETYNPESECGRAAVETVQDHIYSNSDRIDTVPGYTERPGKTDRSLILDYLWYYSKDDELVNAPSYEFGELVTASPEHVRVTLNHPDGELTCSFDVHIKERRFSLNE